MKAPALSIQVRTFIDKYISSFEDLQVLLLLQSNPDKDWNIVDVAEQLRLAQTPISHSLRELYWKGLLEHGEPGGAFYDFRYRPTSESKYNDVSQLAVAFETARSDIVNYLRKKSGKKE